MQSEQPGDHSTKREKDALALQNAGYGYRKMIPKSSSVLNRQRRYAIVICFVPIVFVIAAIIRTDPQCFTSDGPGCDWQCKLIDSACEWCSTDWIFSVCNRMPIQDSSVELLRKDKCSQTTGCVECISQNYVSPNVKATIAATSSTCGVVGGPSYVQVVMLLCAFLLSIMAVLAVALWSIPIEEQEKEPYTGTFTNNDFDIDSVTSALLGSGRDRRTSESERTRMGNLGSIREDKSVHRPETHDAGAGAGEEASKITNNPAWVQEEDPEEFARKQMLEWGFEV